MSAPIDDEICPITGQPHRYFIFKTFETYELFTLSLDFIEKYSEAFIELAEAVPQIYRKVEIAILGCNCSSVIRKEVKKT